MEMDSVIRIQTWTRLFAFHSTLEILIWAMAKYLGRLSSLILVQQPVKEKEIFLFKPAVLCLKIDLVSYPAYGGWVG